MQHSKCASTCRAVRQLRATAKRLSSGRLPMATLKSPEWRAANPALAKDTAPKHNERMMGRMPALPAPQREQSVLSLAAAMATTLSRHATNTVWGRTTLAGGGNPRALRRHASTTSMVVRNEAFAFACPPANTHTHTQRCAHAASNLRKPILVSPPRPATPPVVSRPKPLYLSSSLVSGGWATLNS